jgi:hypothetical protein
MVDKVDVFTVSIIWAGAPLIVQALRFLVP